MINKRNKPFNQLFANTIRRMIFWEKKMSHLELLPVKLHSKRNYEERLPIRRNRNHLICGSVIPLMYV